MQPVPLLILYCALVVVASLAGGWIPLVFQLTHRRMQIAISFVAGMMLGIGLLHLLPHSFHALGSIDQTALWVMGGFLFMFFLERFFHFHHHDVAEDGTIAIEAVESHDHAHHDHAHCDHDHHHQHAHAPHATTGSLFHLGGAAIGLTLHSLVDGVAIAAAVVAEHDNASVTLAGLGAFLAIALHKPFDSLTIGTLMAASGRSAASRHLVNLLYAFVTPLGVALFYLAANNLEGYNGLGQALGFAAGAFLCIATSDLLPELQFHSHDRTALSIALVAGIALAWSTIFLEGEGHDHAHTAAPAEAHDHDHDHDHPHDHDHK